MSQLLNASQNFTPTASGNNLVHRNAYKAPAKLALISNNYNEFNQNATEFERVTKVSRKNVAQ
jgi:hypothetical protein